MCDQDLELYLQVWQFNSKWESEVKLQGRQIDGWRPQGRRS